MSQLRVTSSTLGGVAFPLDGEYFTIGREPDNNIQLDHTSVSKHHAMLTVDNGDFKLFDLHSTNGVIVNGEQGIVTHLRDGDKILLGEIELRFETGSRTITQLLTPFPPLAPRPSTPSPPSPPSLPKTTARPPTKSVPLTAPQPFTLPVKKPGKLARLLSAFRRTRPTAAPVNTATSPTREDIRSELTQTFGKMGLEMPNPPPPPTRRWP